MEALTPASADDLPPLGDLIADEPFWRHPAARLASQGVAHLRVWTTATDPPGHLAVVAETGRRAWVTESTGRIWAELAHRYGPSLVLLEHYPAPEAGERTESLDLIRIGDSGSPHWLRVWPTPEENPRHAGLELWMAVHGHQIVSKPASWFDSCEGARTAEADLGGCAGSRVIKTRRLRRSLPAPWFAAWRRGIRLAGSERLPAGRHCACGPGTAGQATPASALLRKEPHLSSRPGRQPPTGQNPRACPGRCLCCLIRFAQG